MSGATAEASRPTIPVVIVDAEAQTDAALVETPSGARLLVLHPMQTFSNAVSQITALLPHVHPDQVRAVVRAYLPDATDFETIESSWRRASVRAVPVTDLTKPGSRRPMTRRQRVRTILAHAAVWSSLILVVAAYLVIDGQNGKRDLPFNDPAFIHFATAAHIVCDPIDDDHSRCMDDTDGVTMLSGVLTSPADGFLYQFSYGQDIVVARVFPTEAKAKTWFRTTAHHRLLDGGDPQLAGRYVFYGTDHARVERFAAAMKASLAHH